ncbi:TonB-dependent receptor plug domain-containing protein [Maricaulis salignorans]|uniref:TonB-dependent receptor plug domain-containing protein n=1 Tax=Maricaulis salignorans TaxID=144026 RepID=UPI003A91F9DC
MSNIWDRERLLRSTIIAGLAAAGLAISPSYAQSANDEDESSSDQEVVVVTGSLIRRSEFTSAAPIQVINAEIATLEGLVDTAEMLQGASVASGSVQLNNQFGGYVVEGGTGVNSISLRGLGAQRSLVLVNGHRPGPAGTRGQVGSFDLNVIPSSIVQRFEILKDGASSIYGSDAVAGVINVITRREVDRPEITVSVNSPLAGGGETYNVSGAFGLNFDRGSVVLAAEYQLRESLDVGDREYLRCGQDLVRNAPGGDIIDREDRSVLAGTELGGCNNIYFNTAIAHAAFGGARYIPDPQGVGTAAVPGYRPRENCNYFYPDRNGNGIDDEVADGRPVTCAPGTPAFYEDVLNDARVLTSDAINRQERLSLYGSADFALDFLGGVDWSSEAMFTRRETESDGWRQFFPLIGGATVQGLFGVFGYANDPGYDTAVPLFQPVTLWPSNSRIAVDYFSLNSQLAGGFGTGMGFLSDWSWSVSGQYSRSDGDYEGNGILASNSGDVQFDDNSPVYDPLSAAFLSGNYSDAVYDHLTVNTLGNTVYEQTVLTAVATGDLFDLPAGPVALAVGAEYRTFSIDDQPDQAAQDGDLWGSSSAQVTKGEDTVREIYGEVEIPLIAGQPLFESLTVNLSARMFDYDSAGSDSVWKAGANWQITPTFRLRATQGTSYRAPALYELYLGNQTAFLTQASIDPCINWGTSTNANIRANCAADGIPDTHSGVGSSATVISGGGAGVLAPETSEARTVGFVYTPERLSLSVAIDYFNIEVNDQVSRLGAGAILGGCYGADNFPNAFCDLFERDMAAGAVNRYTVTEVRDSFLNVNSQVTSGVDLTVRYEHEFDFGDMVIEGQGTWTFEDEVLLFDANSESGFDNDDFNGTIGDPEFVANMRTSLTRGDWTYSWFMNYVDGTSNEQYTDRTAAYLGQANAFYDVNVEGTLYHDVSVRWVGSDLSILAGLSNMWDEEPPTVSTGTTTRRGNAALTGTQYDLRGRTLFVRATKTF